MTSKVLPDSNPDIRTASLIAYLHSNRLCTGRGILRKPYIDLDRAFDEAGATPAPAPTALKTTLPRDMPFDPAVRSQSQAPTHIPGNRSVPNKLHRTKLFARQLPSAGRDQGASCGHGGLLYPGFEVDEFLAERRGLQAPYPEQTPSVLSELVEEERFWGIFRLVVIEEIADERFVGCGTFLF